MYCSDFKQQFEQIGVGLTFIRDGLSDYISSGNSQSSELINQWLVSVRRKKETLTTAYKERVGEVLQEWWPEHVVPAWHSGKIHIENDGRVVIDGDLNLSLQNNITYFPSLIKKVSGLLSLSSTIREINGLEEVGKLHIPAPSFTCDTLRVAVKEISFQGKQDLQLNALEKAGDVVLGGCKTVEMKRLKEVGTLTVNNFIDFREVVRHRKYKGQELNTDALITTFIDLPTLEKVSEMFVYGVKGTINIPALHTVEGVFAVSDLQTVVAPALGRVGKKFDIFNVKDPFFPNLVSVCQQQSGHIMYCGTLDGKKFIEVFPVLKQIGVGSEFSLPAVVVDNKSLAEEIVRLRRKKKIAVNGQVVVDTVLS